MLDTTRSIFEAKRRKLEERSLSQLELVTITNKLSKRLKELFNNVNKINKKDINNFINN